MIFLKFQASVLKLLTSLLEDLYGPIIKHSETEKKDTADRLNDSSLSDSSLDSSSDTLGSDKAEFGGRPCLKDRTNSVDKNRACAGNRFIVVEHDKNKDTGQASEEDSRLKEGGVNVLNDLGRTNKCSSDKPEVVLGNRVIVHHNSEITADETNGAVEKHTENLAENSEDAKADSMELKVSVDTAKVSNDTDFVDGTQTQVDNGSFAILDNDLELLLRTQSVDSNKTVDTDKSLDDTNDILAGIDITMIGDIGELGKNVNKESTTDSNGHVNVERKQSENVLDWSKGISEKADENGKVLQPVQLLAGGSHVTRKRPPSPNQDQDLAAVTPPIKRKSLEFNSSVCIHYNICNSILKYLYYPG